MDSFRKKKDSLSLALIRYALDKLDGAELGGRRIRIFEEGKGGGGKDEDKDFEVGNTDIEQEGFVLRWILRLR